MTPTRYAIRSRMWLRANALSIAILGALVASFGLFMFFLVDKAMAAAPLFLAVWSIGTAIGVFRRRRWARISAIWLASAIALGGSLSVVMLLDPRSRAEGFSAPWVHAVSGLIALAGAWWVFLFNSGPARCHFHAPARHSLSASLVACCLCADAAFNIVNAVAGAGLPALHWMLRPPAAILAYAALAGLEVAAAAAAWWRPQRARAAVAAGLAVYVAIDVWTLIAWWLRVRPGYHTVNVATTLVPILALLLTARPWVPDANVYAMQPVDMTLPDADSPAAEGTLTFREVVRFSYFHANRRAWPVTVIAALGIPLSIVMIFVFGTDNPLIQNLLPVGVFFLIWLLLPWWGARRQYRKVQSLRERIVYRLTGFGIHAEGENFKGEIAWKVVHAVRETRTMFLIYQTSQLAWAVPKRFLPGDAGVDAFRDFLASRLLDSGRYSGPGPIASLV
jgi:hypothetical protein